MISTLTSCTKKIEIDPPKGQEAVIIQAYLFNDSICRVQVTKSIDYLSNTIPPRIATATVTLSDNNGNTEVLNYNTATSTYESTTIKGVVSTTYTLKVDLEGKTYQSTSILPTLYPGDSIVPRFKQANAFEEKGWRLYFYGKDPVDELNYYYFKCYGDGVLLNESNQVYVADDKFLSGNIDGVEIDFPVLPNQKIDFKFMSLTKPCFEFYNAAQLQLNNDGGFFSTPPANVPSMFDNGAIGIFQCSTLQLMQTQVPNYIP
jgi:hypothetical protein